MHKFHPRLMAAFIAFALLAYSVGVYADVTPGDGPAGVGTTDGSSELQLWLKADALSLANGTPVASWNDDSGSGNAAIQATSSRQPQYLTGQLNGLPVLRFDADYFNSVTLSSQSGNITWVAVISPDHIGAYHNIIDDDVSNRPMLWVDQQGEYELNYGPGGIAELSSQGAGGWDILFAVTRSPGSSEIYLNNATQTGSAPGNLGNPSSEIYDLFNRDGAEAFVGEVAEFIAYDTALNANEINQVGYYLQEKYGLNLNFTPPEIVFEGYTTDPAVYAVGTGIQPNTPIFNGGGASGFAITPSLPIGLNLNPTTGEISGTPLAASPETVYTVTASFASSPDSLVDIVITVLPQSTLIAYSSNPAVYVVDLPFTENSPTIVGAVPTGFSISPALTAGMSIHPTSGAISGTPTVLSPPTDYLVTATFPSEPDSTLTLSIAVAAEATTLRISEFVASNDNSLDDGDGNSPDWIEIHNYGDVAIDLAGWTLTDRADDLSKWVFPAITIQPNAYLVVFASNQNSGTYIDAGGNYHTNFSLSAGGEYLGLVHPDGVTVIHEYAPVFPTQLTDISYGRSGSGLIGYFESPTPGTANPSEPSSIGPSISDVTDSPSPIPEDDDNLVITARVDAFANPVSSVTLHYRAMFGATVTLPMSDDGIGADASAGDGIYTAVIPDSATSPGEMMRWYVTATDTMSEERRAPTFLNPTQSPEYFGTLIADPAAISLIPVFHWWVDNVPASDTRNGTRASVYFKGQFYDNVFNRVRGATSVTWSKKAYKFDFNPGHHLEFEEGIRRAEEINLNTTAQDKSYVRETLSYESFRKAGVPACYAFPVRVEQNGQFFSVASFVEQVDDDFLDRRGLDPEGSLYKMFNGITSTSGAEKKTRPSEGTDDVQALINGLATGNPSRAQYLFDNIDLPAAINYATSGIIVQDFDRGAKNYYIYRDTNGSGEWTEIPWDEDLTFGDRWQSDEISGDGFSDETNPATSRSHPFWGAAGHNLFGTNMMIDAIVANAVTKEMYLRRLRTLMDEQLQPPTTLLAEQLFEARLDELFPLLQQDAALDLAKWGSATIPAQPAVQDLQTAFDLIKNSYLAERRLYLYNSHVNTGVGIPSAQPGIVALAFGVIEFAPTSGNQQEEYIEITNPNAFAVDISGWTLEDGVSHTFKPGTVIPSSATNVPLHLSPDVVAFRNRAVSPTVNETNFVQGNYDGQLSARGESLTIRDSAGNIVATTSYVGSPSDPQQYLRITEINYHPANPTVDELNSDPLLSDGDFEFVELKNVGPSPIDISGCAFVAGIDFIFPPATILASGEIALLVANQTAFEQRYGSGLNVLGEYVGRFGNNGDFVNLQDSVGENILKFAYNDAWYPATDGQGYTLTIIDETELWSTWDVASSWGISCDFGGTPGADNGALFSTQFEGWLNSHFTPGMTFE